MTIERKNYKLSDRFINVYKWNAYDNYNVKVSGGR